MINSLLCDSEIIQLLKQNNNIVWGFIHVKYSTMMYNCIIKYTDNQLFADEILKNAFAKLKLNTTLILQSGSLGLCLLDQARNAALEFLGIKNKVF